MSTDAHYPGSLLDGAHPGLAADCPDPVCVRQRATATPDLRQRIADLLVDRCPDHGCVEPEWAACHCELADPLLALVMAERSAAYRDGQAQSPDESVQVNGVKYRDAATARAAGAFSQHAANQAAGEA